MKAKHTSAANTGRAKILAGVLALILHGRSTAADEETSPDALQNIELVSVQRQRSPAMLRTEDAEPIHGCSRRARRM